MNDALKVIAQAQSRMLEIVYLKARAFLSSSEQAEIEKLLATQKALFKALDKAPKK